MPPRRNTRRRVPFPSRPAPRLPAKNALHAFSASSRATALGAVGARPRVVSSTHAPPASPYTLVLLRYPSHRSGIIAAESSSPAAWTTTFPFPGPAAASAKAPRESSRALRQIDRGIHTERRHASLELVVLRLARGVRALGAFFGKRRFRAFPRRARRRNARRAAFESSKEQQESGGAQGASSQQGLKTLGSMPEDRNPFRMLELYDVGQTIKKPKTKDFPVVWGPFE